MPNLVSVVIPQDLREKAGRLGINVSKVSREALANEVEKVEKELGLTND